MGSFWMPGKCGALSGCQEAVSLCLDVRKLWALSGRQEAVGLSLDVRKMWGSLSGCQEAVGLTLFFFFL